MRISDWSSDVCSSDLNDLEMKFVDESGDNVWGVKRTGYEFPTQWTPVRYKKRHIVKAWGRSPDRVLRNSAKREFTISTRVGGQGPVWVEELRREGLGTEEREVGKEGV